jgi:hypothetical protein
MSTDLIDPEKMSPEGLEIATTYLNNKGDMQATSAVLNMPIADVESMLGKREVKNFIDKVYHEAGFRNRFKLAAVMDAIIEKKLEEMDDTDMGSSKDIAELIKLQHDMKMKEMELEMKLLEKAEARDNIRNQTNIQNNYNVTPELTGYEKLLTNLGMQGD